VRGGALPTQICRCFCKRSSDLLISILSTACFLDLGNRVRPYLESLQRIIKSAGAPAPPKRVSSLPVRKIVLRDGSTAEGSCAGYRLGAPRAQHSWASRVPSGARKAGGDRRRRLRFETESVVVRSHARRGIRQGEADVALPRMSGRETCPVCALEVWLRRAGPAMTRCSGG